MHGLLLSNDLALGNSYEEAFSPTVLPSLLIKSSRFENHVQQDAHELLMMIWHRILHDSEGSHFGFLRLQLSDIRTRKCYEKLHCTHCHKILHREEDFYVSEFNTLYTKGHTSLQELILELVQDGATIQDLFCSDRLMQE